MKKVILGSAMLISGIIGIIGLMFMCTIKEIDSTGSIIAHVVNHEGQLAVLALFIILAISGIIIGLLGAFSKNND